MFLKNFQIISWHLKSKQLDQRLDCSTCHQTGGQDDDQGGRLEQLRRRVFRVQPQSHGEGNSATKAAITNVNLLQNFNFC